MIENQYIEYKSLKKVVGSTADLKALAETCVCFANAQGGTIVVGVEDGEDVPPKSQRIDEQTLNRVIPRLRDLTDSVGIADPEIIELADGSQYFQFKVLPSIRTIATTSSGKVFVRVADNCFPVSGEELTTLAADKNAFQWEMAQPLNLSLDDMDVSQMVSFLEGIQLSEKVSPFIKEKASPEILEIYRLVDNDRMTNLGILWLGKANQRARLSYPLTVQYIVYNEQEEKIRKEDWHFHELNPKQMLVDIEEKAIELTYSSEIPDGLFRKQIRNYPPEVIRELLVNAFAHKRYTISGDIFIEVYPDRLTISNPGALPIGITKDNILHARQRRNPLLIKTLHDLNLMEGEGSGYDLIFEKLSREGKSLPLIESMTNRMSVTIFSEVVDSEILMILDYLDQNFDLSQKEFITIRAVADEKKILTTQLTEKLHIILICDE